MKTNKEFLEELKITHKENSSFLFFLDFYTSNPTPLKPIFSAPNCYDIKAIVEDFVSNSKVKIDDSEKKYLLRCLKYKDANKYKNNEYLNLLDKVSYNKKKLNILDWVINPYEIFISGDSYLQFDKNQYFIPLSFTDKELRFKKIFFNKFTQFNISPLEIESMKLPLKIIKGNVLILGLREGYFAYMASLNKNVKSITIVEENKELIKFFNEAILPNCNKDVKINIVKGKYQKYIKKIADNDFNYIFCNVGRYNASKYLELKGIFDNFIYTKAIYYREESIITDLSVSLTSALLNERKTPIYEKLNTLKLDNIYDYRKLYSFHGLLDFYKK